MVDRLQMDSVYVLRVRGCNKAGFGEYSEEVYLHTPPASGEICTTITLHHDIFIFYIHHTDSPSCICLHIDNKMVPVL